MTVLTKPDIVEGLHDGSIVVDPAPEYIGPNSIDLRLHPELKVYTSVVRRHAPDDDEWPMLLKPAYERTPLDARSANPTEAFTIPDAGYVLVPGVLYIGRTVERTYTPQHVPKIGGRSSTGRLGIEIHQTAGFGDVGFNGTWTLEITVVHPVRVYPRMRIAQLWLMDISSELPPSMQYRGRYQGQLAATPYRGNVDDAPGGGA